MNILCKHTKKQWVAFLIMGSAAFLLLSCNSKRDAAPVNPEAVVSMRSDTLAMMVSKNGLKSYFFEAPLMEEYSFAKEPYVKYPAGVSVKKFRDSTEIVESTLRANEAIYYKKRGIWMASGNVIATGSGSTLYTEQLFWDEKTDRIYSNVDTRVKDQDGEHFGEGLESDASLKKWVFRNYEGTIALETAPNEGGMEEAANVGSGSMGSNESGGSGSGTKDEAPNSGSSAGSASVLTPAKQAVQTKPITPQAKPLINTQKKSSSAGRPAVKSAE